MSDLITMGDEPSKAPYRIKLALDRTMLAWVRTSLSMASFGFGMVAFFRALKMIAKTEEAQRLHQGAIHFGTALLLLGIASVVLSGLSHWSALRRLQRGEHPLVRQWPLSITFGMLVAVLGLVGMWSVFHH
jgi:putative membrane protein